MTEYLHRGVIKQNRCMGNFGMQATIFDGISFTNLRDLSPSYEKCKWWEWETVPGAEMMTPLPHLHLALVGRKAS